MKISLSIFAGILALAGALPGVSSTLTVQASATPDSGLYDYSYIFSITGAGSNIDNIFLGSDDLSPLNVVLMVDGSLTADWSWLGNDIPLNYLQFFNVSGGALGDGHALDATFSSPLAPSATKFAVGLDSSTSAPTNTVTGLLAPIAAPEPGGVLLVAFGLMLFSVVLRYANRVRQ